MQPEFSSFIDKARSFFPEQRGLRKTLRREVEGCFDFFDEKYNGVPISEIHANGLTIGRLEGGKGYAVKIQEYRYPASPEEKPKIDLERFTYQDVLTIKDGKMNMRRASAGRSFTRQSLPREQAESIIFMLQHVTVPYNEKVKQRQNRRGKAKRILDKVKGRLPARLFSYSKGTGEN